MVAFLIIIPCYVSGIHEKKMFKFHRHGSLGLSSISGVFKLFVISVVTILSSIKTLVVCIYVTSVSLSCSRRKRRTHIDCDNVRSCR